MPSSKRVLKGDEAAALQKVDFWLMANPSANQPSAEEQVKSVQELKLIEQTLEQRRLEIEQRASEVESIRQQAFDEGLTQGQQQGYDKGWEQAHLERQTLVRLSASLSEEISQLHDVLANRIMGLSIQIARRVVLDSIAVEPEGAKKLFNDSIETLSHDLRKVVIHAHPDTLTHLSAQFGDSTEIQGLRLIPDTSLALGGFRLTHSEGEFDCTTETRWKNVLKALGRDDPLQIANPAHEQEAIVEPTAPSSEQTTNESESL